MSFFGLSGRRVREGLPGKGRSKRVQDHDSVSKCLVVLFRPRSRLRTEVSGDKPCRGGTALNIFVVGVCLARSDLGVGESETPCLRVGWVWAFGLRPWMERLKCKTFYCFGSRLLSGRRGCGLEEEGLLR